MTTVLRILSGVCGVLLLVTAYYHSTGFEEVNSTLVSAGVSGFFAEALPKQWLFFSWHLAVLSVPLIWAALRQPGWFLPATTFLYGKSRLVIFFGSMVWQGGFLERSYFLVWLWYFFLFLSLFTGAVVQVPHSKSFKADVVNEHAQRRNRRVKLMSYCGWVRACCSEEEQVGLCPPCRGSGGRVQGSRRIISCRKTGQTMWPDGELTSFPMAVKCGEEEDVVFSWIVWPSREARDAGNKAAMEDSRFEDWDPGHMPFDGKRMIFGGFTTIVRI